MYYSAVRMYNLSNQKHINIAQSSQNKGIEIQ